MKRGWPSGYDRRDGSEQGTGEAVEDGQDQDPFGGVQAAAAAVDLLVPEAVGGVAVAGAVGSRQETGRCFGELQTETGGEALRSGERRVGEWWRYYVSGVR